MSFCICTNFKHATQILYSDRQVLLFFYLFNLEHSDAITFSYYKITILIGFNTKEAKDTIMTEKYNVKYPIINFVREQNFYRIYILKCAFLHYIVLFSIAIFIKFTGRFWWHIFDDYQVTTITCVISTVTNTVLLLWYPGRRD